MAEAERFLTFHSTAVPDDTLLVTRIAGEEEISRPFRFEIELVSLRNDLDLAAILKEPARLEVVRATAAGTRGLPIHGILESFEQLDEGPNWSNYRAVLVPRLTWLMLGRESRVFQDETVPEIVTDVLHSHGLLRGMDFDFEASGQHPKREYTVQYQESDFDFVSRLLEDEGIFYFFEQGEKCEKIVFADAANAVPALPDEAQVRYRTSAGMAEFSLGAAVSEHREAVTSLTGRFSAVPEKVVLKDYNYRKPSVDLETEAKAADGGRGTVYHYGEHFKDAGQGKALAQLRGEEIRCRQRTWAGRGDCRGFRAGHTFTLAEHPRSDWNAGYLLVSVKHRGAQTVALGANKRDDEPDYANEFTAIPADVVFRPARVTPWPVIAGPIHGFIDGPSDGKYADLDDEGRYRVLLPFDREASGGGKASRPVRMAQPYAGADMGMHFPLHIGTEVLIVHIDGDPDRPIIAAAVPNPETASPVTGSNHTQCAIHTGGGNRMVIEDNEGKQAISLSSPTAGTQIQLGEGSKTGIAMKTAADLTQNIDGNQVKEVGGNKDTQVQGSDTEIIHGNKKTITFGNKEEITQGNSFAVTQGIKQEMNMALRQELTAAASNTVSGGVMANITAAAALEIAASMALKLKVGGETEIEPLKKKEASTAQELIGTALKVVGQSTEKAGVKKLLADLWQSKVSQFVLNVSTFVIKAGMFKTTASTWITKASGTADIKASTITLKAGGGSVKVSGGSVKVAVGGNGVKVSGGMTTIGGSNLKVLS